MKAKRGWKWFRALFGVFCVAWFANALVVGPWRSVQAYREFEQHYRNLGDHKTAEGFAYQANFRRQAQNHIFSPLLVPYLVVPLGIYACARAVKSALSARQRSVRRAWAVYLSLTVASFAALNIYWYWRSTTFVPFSAPVNLAETGWYRTFPASGFDAQRYYVGFDLDLPFSKTHRWIFDENEKRVWSEVDPVVEFFINDADGRTLVHDRGEISRESGWVLTNSGKLERLGTDTGYSVASIYKSLDFRPRRFHRYVVSLRVLRGAVSAKSYSPHLFLATTSSYVMLGAIIHNVLLIILWLVVAAVLAVVLRFMNRSPSAGSPTPHSS